MKTEVSVTKDRNADMVRAGDIVWLKPNQATRLVEAYVVYQSLGGWEIERVGTVDAPLPMFPQAGVMATANVDGWEGQSLTVHLPV